MSKRLQVLLDEDEHRELQRIAKARRTTVAEWVRRRIREGLREESPVDPAVKLAALHATMQAARAHDIPSPDLEQMLEEIERGYLQAAEPSPPYGHKK